ncbi:MAG: NAD(P)H-hydrate dehydratase [Selenomonadaceae bacterium]|nr:NAD(P)H-hydrate dehydratase [Selenomonadaceae bacterium]
MKISLVDEMRAIDKKATEEFGIPELLLMENAGHQAAEATENFLGGVHGKTICVLAGTGNNGGDAFVAARHLSNHGAKVKVFMAGNPAHLTRSAAVNRDIVGRMGIEVKLLEGERSLDKLRVFLKRFADGILDGILGTGVKGAPRKDIADLIRVVNESGKPVVSIDVPSGIEADTGEAPGEAVRADLTISLGLPKIGHFFCPGAECTGKLLVDDIGIPSQLLEAEELKQELIDDALAETLFSPRPMDVHKGSCGRVLVVAGSRGMTGAAALASRAVLRSGAGISTLAVAESLHDIMEGKLTEVMTQPIPEVASGVLGGDRAMGSLLQLVESHDVVLLGPGLGRRDETGNLVRHLLANINKPVILDADAIYAYRKHPELLAECKKPPILTPHLGEMAALLDISVPELRSSLLPMVREAAREYQSVFVVKSECTIVVYPDGEAFFTTKGNPGMATAGCGDVLAGTIAGLVCQTEEGLAPLAGVYLHGLAGDLAYEEKGEGLIASDVLEKLPEARRGIRSLGMQKQEPQESP